jgi:hypothetical protein
MELFDWMLVGHLVGDYILQTRWMGDKKAQEWVPLTVHSVVYTAAVALLALLAGGLSAWGIIIIFVSHVLIDQRKIINFLSQHFNGIGNVDWLKVTLDQSWHIVMLAIATLIR